MAGRVPVNPEWEVREVLRAAVSGALRAPSVLNTQPWRWRLAASTLELRRDADRQLRSLDESGRLATLSCGAVLQHARVALAASGYGDALIDWLRAGEATSAVWLMATANGLAMSAISDVVEVPESRALLTAILAAAGHPQLVLRTGLQAQPVPPPNSSRRKLDEVLEEVLDDASPTAMPAARLRPGLVRRAGQ